MCSRQFTDNDIEILMILSDEEGHAQWELSNRTGIAKSNLNTIIRKLKMDDVVCEGDPRKTTNTSSRCPNMKEIPLYINKDWDIYQDIILIIHYKIEELLSYVLMAKDYAETIATQYNIERQKLCLDAKTPLNDRHDIDLRIKFEKKMSFKGHNVSFYEEKYDRYLDYFERFILSLYTERMIEKLGFNSIFRINITGMLDIWYRENLIDMASNKNLIEVGVTQLTGYLGIRCTSRIIK